MAPLPEETVGVTVTIDEGTVLLITAAWRLALGDVETVPPKSLVTDVLALIRCDNDDDVSEVINKHHATRLVAAAKALAAIGFVQTSQAEDG